MPDFDVVVVGAGCAGLRAACAAAGRGVKTLVLEQEGGIGENIRCAEGVGRKGFSRAVEVDGSWVASVVDRGRFCAPDGRTVDADEPGCGYILHKDILLRALARRAEESGAEVRTGARVTSLERPDGRTFRVCLDKGAGLTCRALVAADGVASGVARMAGLDTHVPVGDLFICAQHSVSGIDVDPHRVEFHFGNSIAPGGYAWVFPKGGGRANVGVGMTRRGRGGHAGEYLAAFMERRCPGARVERSVAGGVPAARRSLRAHVDGLFLAGDAARVADPVSGAGIVQAMESGAVSGEYAALHALGDADPADLRRRFARKFGAVTGGRGIRYGIRQIFSRLTDEEFSTVVGLIGEYRSSGASLQAPGSLLGFLMRSMPRTFGMLRHLAGD